MLVILQLAESLIGTAQVVYGGNSPVKRSSGLFGIVFPNEWIHEDV